MPAVEIARGDLVEVQPASYGVHSQAFHFWSGPGRSEEDGGDNDGTNYYENYAEATAGKRVVALGGMTYVEAGVHDAWPHIYITTDIFPPSVIWVRFAPIAAMEVKAEAIDNESIFMM